MWFFLFLFFLNFMLGNNIQDTGECQTVDESRDNRVLIDDNKAQSLTGEDIDEMRRWFYDDTLC